MNRLIRHTMNVGLLLIAAVAGLGDKVYAQGLELKPSDIRGTTKQKPVSVLQQRYFQKAWRPELGIMASSFLNEAYTNTAGWGGRLGVFFNEWLGFEVQYLKTKVADSDDRKALNSLKYRRLEEDTVVSPDPEVNPVFKATDVGFVLAPFYGKLNFIDMLIVYTDIYLNLGVTSLDTEQGRITGGYWSLGERFYVLNNLSVRLDFKDRIYTEKRAGKPSQKNGLSWELGISYFFGENRYAR